MAEEQLYNSPEGENEGINFEEVFFKYLSYWKWIIASILICLVFAFLYLRYTPPVFRINSTILLKDDKKGGGTELSMFEDMGFLNNRSNVDNEVEVLRSKNLIRSVVKELNLYTRYERQGRIRNTDLYNTSPFLVSLAGESLDTLSNSLSLEIKAKEDGSVKIKGRQRKEKFEAEFDKLPVTFETPAGLVTIEQNFDVEPEYSRKIYATIIPPILMTRNFLSRFELAPTSKTTSVLDLTITDINIARGVDFLNKLVANYNRDAIDDKNRIAQTTEIFIDDRLGKIDIELGDTERDLEEYKQKEGITDIHSDAQLFLKENSDYQKKKSRN